MEKLNLSKKVYAKNQYEKVINTNFSQIATSPTATTIVPPLISVEEFFQNYSDIFFDIPKFGDTPETVKYKLNQLDEGFKNISESIKPSAKSQNLQQPTGGQTSMPPQSGFKILNVRDK